MTAPLNLARPSPDRIIEANRPRDGFDAHCDYVATGDARYRAERLAHEKSDDAEGPGIIVYLIGAIVIEAGLLLGIPAVCWIWQTLGKMLGGVP